MTELVLTSDCELSDMDLVELLLLLLWLDHVMDDQLDLELIVSDELLLVDTSVSVELELDSDAEVL